MEKSRLYAQARLALDRRFRDFPSPGDFAPPTKGWIRAIRTGLGMTAAQLARRLGVTQPTVADLERSEDAETIQLASLRRAAEAMGCTLIYALVPSKPLEALVRERALEIARRQLLAVDHSMRLEKQGVEAKALEPRIAALARDLTPRQLWEEP